MIKTGTTYTLHRLADGYDIHIDGELAGWSAGNLEDARNTARAIARDRGTDPATLRILLGRRVR